jgi:hypothetical protein
MRYGITTIKRVAVKVNHDLNQGAGAVYPRFAGTRGGMLSESLYGRFWHGACDAALGPGPGRHPACPPALRPAARRPLSLWLNASTSPADIAARAGNSVHVLQTVYAHCADGRDEIVSQQIERALRAGRGSENLSLSVTASGSPDRCLHPEPVRYMSVNGPHPPARRTASRPRASARHIRRCPGG